MDIKPPRLCTIDNHDTRFRPELRVDSEGKLIIWWVPGVSSHFTDPCSRPNPGRLAVTLYEDELHNDIDFDSQRIRSWDVTLCPRVQSGKEILGIGRLPAMDQHRPDAALEVTEARAVKEIQQDISDKEYDILRHSLTCLRFRFYKKVEFRKVEDFTVSSKTTQRWLPPSHSYSLLPSITRQSKKGP